MVLCPFYLREEHDVNSREETQGFHGKKIRVEWGKEYQAIKECIYQEGSFFEDVYQRARDCIEEIVNISEQMLRSEVIEDGAEALSYGSKCGCLDGREGASSREIVKLRSSNLIAFCADRGQGKTSAMLSFANALRNIERNRNTVAHKNEFWGERIAYTYHYEVIESIDPTSMENDDSILKIVLSRMYENFQRVYQECCTQRSHAGRDADWERSRDELVNRFLRCFHFANMMNASEKRKAPLDIEDELECITDQGDSSNLRLELYQLFRSYKNFVAPDRKTFLVLSIDDADVNTKRVYDIMEDIRKYLQMPGVIVLLAANMTQLESTVEQYFLQQYSDSLKYSRSMVSVERCHHIAVHYLEKVIPSTRRVFLPDLDHLLQNNYEDFQVVYLKEKAGADLLEKGRTDGKTETGDPIPPRSYQKQLLHYLHRKTGMIFLAPDAYLHNFLPSNLRELTHFLAYFRDMEDVEDGYQSVIRAVFSPEQADKDVLTLWRKNLELTQNYLLDLWSASNLRTAGRSILREFAAQPEDNKHRYLLKVLPDYYSNERIEYNSLLGLATGSAADYRKQFIDKCVEEGIYRRDENGTASKEETDASYADVVTAMRVLKKLPGGNRQYKFAYAVRMYCSIYLHLRLLENLNHHPQNPYYLTHFLRNSLFKRGERGRADVSFVFWQLPVPRSRIQTAIDRLDEAQIGFDRLSGVTTQSVNTIVSNWFRKMKQEEQFCETQYIDIKNNKHILHTSEEDLVFSPLYWLLAEVDHLTSGSSGEIGEYQEPGIGWARMLAALVIVLNWDAQYYLMHAFPNVQAKPGMSLKEMLCGIYCQDAMGGFLQKVDELNSMGFTAVINAGNHPFDALNNMDDRMYEIIKLLLPGLEGYNRNMLCSDAKDAENSLRSLHSEQKTLTELQMADSSIYKGQVEAELVMATINTASYHIERCIRYAGLLQYLELPDVVWTSLQNLLNMDAMKYNSKSGIYSYKSCTIEAVMDTLQSFIHVVEEIYGTGDEADASSHDDAGTQSNHPQNAAQSTNLAGTAITGSCFAQMIREIEVFLATRWMTKETSGENAAAEEKVEEAPASSQS